MVEYLRNPLTYAWAFLVAITVASWWISGGGGAAYRADAAVTVGVLLIAALKSRLVMRYFMEVRNAPAWLRRTTDAWLLLLFALLLGFYFVRL